MKRINPREVIGHKNENRCKKNGCKPPQGKGWRSWQTSRCEVCKRPFTNADLKKKV